MARLQRNRAACYPTSFLLSMRPDTVRQSFKSSQRRSEDARRLVSLEESPINVLGDHGPVLFCRGCDLLLLARGHDVL